MSRSTPVRWTIVRLVPLLAGTVVLLSAALTIALSSWWAILAALVGANLLLYSAAGWCPATLVMTRLGMSAGCGHRPGGTPA